MRLNNHTVLKGIAPVTLLKKLLYVSSSYEQLENCHGSITALQHCIWLNLSWEIESWSMLASTTTMSVLFLLWEKEREIFTLASTRPARSWSLCLSDYVMRWAAFFLPLCWIWLCVVSQGICPTTLALLGARQKRARTVWCHGLLVKPKFVCPCWWNENATVFIVNAFWN